MFGSRSGRTDRAQRGHASWPRAKYFLVRPDLTQSIKYNYVLTISFLHQIDCYDVWTNWFYPGRSRNLDLHGALSSVIFVYMRDVLYFFLLLALYFSISILWPVGNFGCCPLSSTVAWQQRFFGFHQKLPCINEFYLFKQLMDKLFVYQEYLTNIIIWLVFVADITHALIG